MKKIYTIKNSKAPHETAKRHKSQKISMKQGSALLIAILVMGVLLVLTLGLSDLVIQEIRQTTDVVASGQAYFSAEAGVENGLLDLHENLPGYETPTSSSDQSVPVQDQATGLNASYSILNKASSVPAFDPNQPVFLTKGVPTNPNSVYDIDPEATYSELPLNQSVVIPLYSANNTDPNSTSQNGSYSNVTNFLIEYYVDYQSMGITNVSSQDLNQLDILRWKIFGKPQDTNDTTGTESISDFFPSTSDATAYHPVCIGTDNGLAPTANNQGCIFPFLATDNTGKDATDTSSNLWGAARECYLSDSGGSGQGLADIQKICTIQNFINSHNQNYLVLTNVINPDVILPGQALDTPQAKAMFAIHYRIIASSVNASDPKLVRQSASINAEGSADNGQVKQSINVQIDQTSFLPVFNFSLYQTDTTQKSAITPITNPTYQNTPGI